MRLEKHPTESLSIKKLRTRSKPVGRSRLIDREESFHVEIRMHGGEWALWDIQDTAAEAEVYASSALALSERHMSSRGPVVRILRVLTSRYLHATNDTENTNGDAEHEEK